MCIRDRFSVDEKRIDEINILNATYEAMNGAVNGLSTAPDFVLIDGNRISGMEIPHETVVKGDSCLLYTSRCV